MVCANVFAEVIQEAEFARETLMVRLARHDTSQRLVLQTKHHAALRKLLNRFGSVKVSQT